jgi:hypothetical protein
VRSADSVIFLLIVKMFIFTRRQWKPWCKLWKRRQKRLLFYQALAAFYTRNNLNSLLQASKKKQKLYKKRMNLMYKKKMNRLFKKLKTFKKKIIKFQLKYGIYYE